MERDVFSEERAQPTKRIYLLIREVLDPRKLREKEVPS